MLDDSASAGRAPEDLGGDLVLGNNAQDARNSLARRPTLVPANTGDSYVADMPIRLFLEMSPS